MRTYSVDHGKGGLHSIEAIVANFDRDDLSARCDAVQLGLVAEEAGRNGRHVRSVRARVGDYLQDLVVAARCSWRCLITALLGAGGVGVHRDAHRVVEHVGVD